MHPFLSHQLARSRQEVLRRDAETARPSKPSRPTADGDGGSLSDIRWRRRYVLLEETRSCCESGPW